MLTGYNDYNYESDQEQKEVMEAARQHADWYCFGDTKVVFVEVDDRTANSVPCLSTSLLALSKSRDDAFFAQTCGGRANHKLLPDTQLTLRFPASGWSSEECSSDTFHLTSAALVRWISSELKSFVEEVVSVLGVTKVLFVTDSTLAAHDYSPVTTKEDSEDERDESSTDGEAVSENDLAHSP